MKTLPLGKHGTIPALGFGTWKITGQAAYDAVTMALKVGYRHIDTADMYGNHQPVGQAIKDSGIARQDLFLTTKVWRNSLQADAVEHAVHRFLVELQTDYIDLLLIHWPNREVPMAETLGAMQQAQKSGLVKHIGVSNFTARHLDEAKATGTEVADNQVELHPAFPQLQLAEYCKANHITLTAYSPLGRGGDLQLPLIQEMARKYGKSEPQVILNWILSRGIVAIPKGISEQHIRDNFGALDWSMDPADVEAINQMGINHRNSAPEWNEF